MKKIFKINSLPNFVGVFIGLCAVLFILPVSADEAVSATGPKQDLSYFFGYSFGNMLKEGGNSDVELETLKQGMQDALDGVAPNLTPEQQKAVVEIIRNRQQKAADRELAARRARKAVEDEQAAGRLAEATTWLSMNAAQSGIQKTASGLQYETLKAGNGSSPVSSDRVLVHYTGTLTNGTVFDSSVSRGEPAEFGLTQVIQGWTEGLQLMKVGGKMRFFIPPDLGYGPGGSGKIPPNSVLIFEVELLEIR